MEFLRDLTTGYLAMPPIGQIGVAFFILCAIVMLAGPSVTKRRHRARFTALAAARLQAVKGRDWPFTFTATAAGRTYTVSYDYRMTSRGSSYRGPSGHLLITATALASRRWPLHQVDLIRLDSRVARALAGLAGRKTGYATFDHRFLVREDGMPVRAGWLDAPTRDAILGFGDNAPKDSTLWIKEGQLQCLMPEWPGGDPALDALLQRQADLAAALERTARS